MNPWRHRIQLSVILLMIPAVRPAAGQEPAGDPVFSDPETLVRGLYAAVTFPPGTTDPDWARVRAFFLPEAVFAMRRTPTSMAVLDLKGFVDWFIEDFQRVRMGERGFEETVQTLKLTRFGGMAHCFVVYRARLMTPADQRGEYGLDSFGLVELNGRWWIASITNDVVSRDRPLPEGLRPPAPPPPPPPPQRE
jgi:hypothetical protein